MERTGMSASQSARPKGSNCASMLAQSASTRISDDSDSAITLAQYAIKRGCDAVAIFAKQSDGQAREDRVGSQESRDTNTPTPSKGYYAKLSAALPTAPTPYQQALSTLQGFQKGPTPVMTPQTFTGSPAAAQGFPWGATSVLGHRIDSGKLGLGPGTGANDSMTAPGGVAPKFASSSREQNWLEKLAIWPFSNPKPTAAQVNNPPAPIDVGQKAVTDLSDYHQNSLLYNWPNTALGQPSNTPGRGSGYPAPLKHRKVTPASVLAPYYAKLQGGLAGEAEKAMAYREKWPLYFKNTPRVDYSRENLLRPRDEYMWANKLQGPMRNEWGMEVPRRMWSSNSAPMYTIERELNGHTGATEPFSDIALRDRAMAHQLEQKEPRTYPWRSSEGWFGSMPTAISAARLSDPTYSENMYATDIEPSVGGFGGDPASPISQKYYDRNIAIPLKRLYSQITGHPVNTPEDAEAAIAWADDMYEQLKAWKMRSGSLFDSNRGFGPTTLDDYKIRRIFRALDELRSNDQQQGQPGRNEQWLIHRMPGYVQAKQPQTAKLASDNWLEELVNKVQTHAI